MNHGIVAGSDCIVHENGPVTLVGAGQATPQDISSALTLAPKCVAADGGAVLALSAGIMPDAVIGDFDSIPPEVERQIPDSRLHRIAEQDSTDFEKALTRIDAPVVIGVGFMGGRVDHQLGALHTLMVCADRPCVLIGGAELIFLAPPRIALPTKPAEVVSLFPLGPVAARSTGLHWPLDDVPFAPGVRSGTSNRATGALTIVVDRPAMLLIVPRRLLRPVVSALAAPSSARWPARAE